MQSGNSGQTPGPSRTLTRVNCSTRAPGRVNIIGEHTDYNDGLVLPTTTALYTTVDAARRSDRMIHADSTNVQDTQNFYLDNIQPVESPGWIDYIKGVAAELQAAGIDLHGADLEISSDIPLGGGLSSSASLELAVATALLGISSATLPQTEVAKLCRRAENRYAGVSCGIMDQYVIACCDSNMAMLLDCRNLAVDQVAIPDSVRLLITDSGVKHRLPDSGYNTRADECAEAVNLLAKVEPQIAALRDLTLDTLDAEKERLGDLLYRRCRHVVTENERVQHAFAAMQSGDIRNLGKLISASHNSLRDDFEVSCNEVDRLVDIADASVGVLGSRMVGAGFGGCVLSLVESDKIDQAARRIRRRYKEIVGGEPWTHIVRPADPAGTYG